MFRVRHTMTAKGGRRDQAVGIMKEFYAEAAKEFGSPSATILTASIGPSDSTVVTEADYDTLAALEKHIDQMNTWPKLETYGPKFSEVFIDGTHRIEVYRIRS